MAGIGIRWAAWKLALVLGHKGGLLGSVHPLTGSSPVAEHQVKWVRIPPFAFPQCNPAIRKSGHRDRMRYRLAQKEKS